MGLIKKVIIGLILLILIVGGIFIYNLYNDNIDVAFLTIETGSAQVDSGNGWKEATNNMKLKLNDKIKTDGVSVITFYESIIVELQPNTDVMIKSLQDEKVSLRQEKGSTWNKFTSISGIESYEVETPTTVATVRGTEFGVYENDILVSEGKVDTKSLDKNIIVEGLGKADIKELKIIELTKEDKIIMLDKAKKTLERLKLLREKIIEDNRDLIEKAIKIYGTDEVELRTYLERIDSGELDDDALIEKSPIKPPVMYRFKKVNDEIRKEQELIKLLESSI